MAELIVSTFLTLDGVAQAPGGPEEDRDGGFEHGGWLVPHFDEELGRTVEDWISRATALLLGRRTYEIFAAHWPHVTGDDPVASKLNSVPKYVASRSLNTVEWRNSTLLKGHVAEEVAELKRRSAGEIQVHGSCGLLQTLIRNDLVDEYRLCVFPVLLGTGKRLFGAGTVPTGLRLRHTGSSGPGVAIHVYERSGDPGYGSFTFAEQRERSTG